MPADLGHLGAGFGIRLDPGVRCVAGGSIMIGGSPLRLLRLTPSGRRLVERLAAGAPVPASPAAQRLVRRLLDRGMAHPRPPAPAEGAAVSVVIPVRDDEKGLRATLAALGRSQPLLVVDDASADGAAVDRACGAAGAAVVRRVHRGGPAAARNAGWRATAEPFVAFVDANCEPEPGWLDMLLPHFADPQVAAVAPRIAPAAAPGAPRRLAAYETVRSPLDLGIREATVRPRSRVPYVPTAALVVRRRALEDSGGFDEALLVGEDVDLVWRLAAAGWTIRYDPRATVMHPTRPAWGRWLQQRYAYGTSAASLARRHGRAVAPASVSAWSAAAWLLVALGRPRGGAAVAAGSAAALASRLRACGAPGGEALRLAALGHLRAGLVAADALRRAWPPAALLLGALNRRSRPALAVAVLMPPLLDWLERRPALDPVRFTALRLADDLAYSAGVWAGCLRQRSARALLPDLAVSSRNQ